MLFDKINLNVNLCLNYLLKQCFPTPFLTRNKFELIGGHSATLNGGGKMRHEDPFVLLRKGWGKFECANRMFKKKLVCSRGCPGTKIGSRNGEALMFWKK
jgi:hypothetical protein